MNDKNLVDTFTHQWNETVKDTFNKYMSIPNVSTAFDDQWKEHGYIDEAIGLLEKWSRANAPENAEVFVQEIEGRTPLLIIDIPANNYEENDCVLLYGHSDKQPPMDGWMQNIEPFAATYKDEKIYGRGGADDGYALFSSVLACKHLSKNNIAHARMLIIIEASEESGSPDLLAHLEVLTSTLSKELESISLVVCLDSGCLTYDHLWVTRSLRGLLQINCDIRVLDQGTHSGGAGGIVPSAFHILRELLDRIAQPATGKILIEELKTEINKNVIDSAKGAGELLKDTNAHGLPFSPGVMPLSKSIADQIIANTYEPQLEIIGIDGIPNIADAGNVLRPHVNIALSFRIPPGVDSQVAAAAVTKELIRDTPFNAQVSVVVDSMANGWEAPKVSQWLSSALEKSSENYFGAPVQFMGEGGTIPFMSMLGEKYPEAQFLVTGLLGPGSNAHGPNEFLHFPTCMKITACVASVLQEHAKRSI